MEKILPTPLFCDDNFKNWEKLKKQRNSDRIFIIGNGPFESFDRSLHKNDELSLPLTKFTWHLNNQYRPSYYMVEDILVAENKGIK